MMKKAKESLEYNKKNIVPFSDVCLPLLQNFPIKTVGYRRFFNDGRYLALSNHLGWQEYYFSQVNDPNQSFGKSIQEACPQNFTYLLWPQLPNEPIFQALYEYDIWHGLSVYRKKEDFVECFAFATTRDIPAAIDFYNKKNLEFLKKFIEYFLVQTHDIIHKCPENALGNFSNFKIKPINYDNSTYEKILLNILNAQYAVGKSPSLTKQERKCLCFIVSGSSIKETASKLMLSNRTVEYHLNNILLKLNIKRKSNLIKLFYKDKTLQNNSISSTFSTEEFKSLQVNKLYLDAKNYLTKRELECAKKLVSGYTAKEIAENLHLSSRTVEVYINSIKNKTGCHFKSQLTKKLINLGIIDIPS